MALSSPAPSESRIPVRIDRFGKSPAWHSHPNLAQPFLGCDDYRSQDSVMCWNFLGINVQFLHHAGVLDPSPLLKWLPSGSSVRLAPPCTRQLRLVSLISYEFSSPRVLLSRHCSRVSPMYASAMLVRLFSLPLMPHTKASSIKVLSASRNLNKDAIFRPVPESAPRWVEAARFGISPRIKSGKRRSVSARYTASNLSCELAIRLPKFNACP